MKKMNDRLRLRQRLRLRMTAFSSTSTLTLTFVLILTLAFTLALVACKKETPKPAVQAQAQKVQGRQAPPPAAPAAKEEKGVETETYSYNPKGRRDPFLSIIEASKIEREAEKKKRGIKPSESYDISDVKVIAIAREKNKYYAMVELPDKKYFTVKVGMTLGTRGGKVIKIDEGGVVVREHVRDYKGEIHTKDTILRLRKEEGE